MIKDRSIVLLFFFITLMNIGGCASLQTTLPTQQEISSLDYGACPTDYEEKIKTYLKKDYLHSYSDQYHITPPRKFWYKAPLLQGGGLYSGYLVLAGVYVRLPWLGEQTYGFLFKNNEIVKVISQDDLKTFSFNADKVINLPKDERGWEVGNSGSGQSHMIIEWVLPGETVNKWSELITLQTFLGVQTRMEPEKIMLDAKESTLKKCPNAKWQVITKKSDEILYEWRTTNCTNFDNQHEIAKILKGFGAMHIVHYVKKGPEMDENDHKKWMDIIEKVKVASDCQ